MEEVFHHISKESPKTKIAYSLTFNRHDKKNPAETNRKIKQTNEEMKVLCRRYGVKIIDNSNISRKMLGYKGWHPSNEGRDILVDNWYTFIETVWSIDIDDFSSPFSIPPICPLISNCQISDTISQNQDVDTVIDDNLSCFDILKELKLKHPLNLCTGYLNINSISNKFDNLKLMLEQNLDIFCIAETKIDQSYP